MSSPMSVSRMTGVGDSWGEPATAGEAKPVGLFGAAGVMRDPDVKKGMGVMLHLLKAMGRTVR